MLQFVLLAYKGEESNFMMFREMSNEVEDLELIAAIGGIWQPGCQEQYVHYADGNITVGS